MVVAGIEVGRHFFLVWVVLFHVLSTRRLYMSFTTATASASTVEKLAQCFAMIGVGWHFCASGFLSGSSVSQASFARLGMRYKRLLPLLYVSATLAAVVTPSFQRLGGFDIVGYASWPLALSTASFSLFDRALLNTACTPSWSLVVDLHAYAAFLIARKALHPLTVAKLLGCAAAFFAFRIYRFYSIGDDCMFALVEPDTHVSDHFSNLGLFNVAQPSILGEDARRRACFHNVYFLYFWSPMRMTPYFLGAAVGLAVKHKKFVGSRLIDVTCVTLFVAFLLGLRSPPNTEDAMRYVSAASLFFEVVSPLAVLYATLRYRGACATTQWNEWILATHNICIHLVYRRIFNM